MEHRSRKPLSRIHVQYTFISLQYVHDLFNIYSIISLKLYRQHLPVDTFTHVQSNDDVYNPQRVLATM